MSLKSWLTSDISGLSKKESFLLHEKRMRSLFVAGIAFIVLGAALVVASNCFVLAVLLPLGGMLVYFSQKYERNTFINYKELYLNPALDVFFGGEGKLIDRGLPSETTADCGLFTVDAAMECVGLIGAQYRGVDALLALQTNYQSVINAQGEAAYRYSFTGLVIRLTTPAPSPCHVRLYSKKYTLRSLADKNLRALELKVHLGKRFDFYSDEKNCAGLCIMLGEALEQIASRFKIGALALNWNKNDLFIAIEDAKRNNPIAIPKGKSDKNYSEAAEKAMRLITAPVDCLYDIIAPSE